MVWGERTARVQHRAPQWRANAVVDGEIQAIASDDFLGQYTVVVFYPAAFSFVCTSELIELSDRISEFNDTHILGISVDTSFVHHAWAKEQRSNGGVGKIRFPMVSDITKEISKAFGVLIEDGADKGLALRGTFILDPQHKVRAAHINDLPVGRSVDETLREIDAFKFTDESGRVCPSSWKKGGDTIDPHPERKLEFFNKKYKDEV